MASFEKTSKGWRAHIARSGVRKSKTFSSKTAATLWAAQQETQITSGTLAAWPTKTLSDALHKYELEVSAKKRGHDFESKRFACCRRPKTDQVVNIGSAATQQSSFLHINDVP